MAGRRYVVLKSNSDHEIDGEIAGYAARGWILTGPVQIAIAGAGMSGMAVRYCATLELHGEEISAPVRGKT